MFVHAVGMRAQSQRAGRITFWSPPPLVASSALQRAETCTVEQQGPELLAYGTGSKPWLCSTPSGKGPSAALSGRAFRAWGECPRVARKQVAAGWSPRWFSSAPGEGPWWWHQRSGYGEPSVKRETRIWTPKASQQGDLLAPCSGPLNKATQLHPTQSVNEAKAVCKTANRV